MSGRIQHLPRHLACNRHVRCFQHRHRLYLNTKSVSTDTCGIPLKPTWSVYQLLSSYPKPAISSTTLKHIHELSALIPPEEGTPEYEKLQQELGDLVKLVEAVKLVDTDGVQFTRRHYDEDWDRTMADLQTVADGGMGQSLLAYAARTEEGLYIVDADRTR